jgi:anion-transporting  ArsA/GET3 family ATPase
MQLLIISGYSKTLQSAMALATAAHAAGQGKRVLLASIGPTHTLGALLGQSLGARPLEITPQLAAMEVLALDEVGKRWDDIRPGFRSGLAARLREIGADELPAFPGLDATGALLVAERARKNGSFDLLVTDGPAPDLLISALSFPDAVRWLVRLLFGLDRGSGRSVSSQERALIPMALIPSSTAAPLQDLRVALEEQRALLSAPNGARVRLALDSFELTLPAVRQALTGLGLYGLACDYLLVNGPSDALDEETRAMFRSGAERVRPDLLLGVLECTPVDLASWSRYGAALYGRAAVAPFAQSAEENGRVVRLAVPFIEAKALDIILSNEELVARLGPYRRHIILPGLSSGGKLRARVENEVLNLWVEGG